MANESLQALIQFTDTVATAQDLNSILIEIDEISGTLAQTANQHPSPSGRVITSTTRMENDTLNISGWLRQWFCNGTEDNRIDYISRFKRVMERQKYAIETFATITTNDGTYARMRLANVNYSRTFPDAAELRISMEWESMNVAGGTNTTFSTSGLL